MGNGLKRWLGCVLPCGALDLIRVVHLNGHVQEFSHPLAAAEILTAAPGHVLTKPTSHGVVRRISILSPESHLKRGGIYFLIPVSSLPRRSKRPKDSSGTLKSSGGELGRRLEDVDVIVMKKKKARRGDRGSSRGCGEEWRPHLESIDED